jgi:pyrimidine operon attenuation protein / uracil phosphoribosyltransferase
LNLVPKATILDAGEMARVLRRMSLEIAEAHRGTENLMLVGIRTRGVPMAEAIARDFERLEGEPPPLGTLDITLYRDDLSLVAPKPMVRASDLPEDISDRVVVLCDDVLYTGRTVRAAIDALLDYGRPRAVRLAALIDRGWRELPLHADFVGRKVPTSRSEVIKVSFEATDGVSQVQILDRPARHDRAELDAQGSPRDRRAFRRRDRARPRDRRVVRRGRAAAGQEGADAARQDGGQPLFEPSTRTLVSFEIAAQRLSADLVNFVPELSSQSKGESLADSIKTIASMFPDFVVVRHRHAGVPAMLARQLRCGVINAGDGAHEHPTQALLDALTIRRHKGRIAGLTVALVGDIAHSRVVRSNLHLLTKLGAHVRVAGPRTMVPRGIERWGSRSATRSRRRSATPTS